MLHITNGDATRIGLERSTVPGTFSAWSDILHEGPTPRRVSPDEWRRVRVEYLTSSFGDYASSQFAQPGDLAAKYRREDEALERWREHDEVIFWFEHDLYDQLLLIRHLAWIGEARLDAGGAAATRFSMVSGDTYLGPLRPDEFPALFERRRPITPAQIERATRAWDAFCGDDPTALVPFAVEDAPDLPYLPGAIRRFLEEFPSTANGLPRSEAQILRVLSEGTRTPEQTFVTASALEERIFMGDAQFWGIATRLAGGRHPLITAAVAGPEPDRLPSGTLDITATGREVLAGRADQVSLNGLDRWMGGVRLTPSRYWRWTGSTLVRGD